MKKVVQMEEEKSVNNQEEQLYVVGTRGYSAHEVAVLEGFEGIVDEWLASLVGPGGEFTVINSNFNTQNNNVKFMIRFSSDIANTVSIAYLKDNKTIASMRLYLPSINGSAITIYENNPE